MKNIYALFTIFLFTIAGMATSIHFGRPDDEVMLVLYIGFAVPIFYIWIEALILMIKDRRKNEPK